MKKRKMENKSEWKGLSLLSLSLAAVIFLPQTPGFALAAEQPDRIPVTISVVVVNPSQDKPRTFPIKIDLPQEVTPDGVLDRGNLTLEYDDQRSIYFLYNQQVVLEPKETRVFKVLVRDVWFVPQETLDKLRTKTDILLKRLEKSEYAEAANKLGGGIYQRLDKIQETQADETLSQKSRIGSYRFHMQMIDQVKEDLQELEKLMTFVGGVPVPEMLEDSPLKSDAPSTKTTWLIIFIILAFIGFVGFQFYITWNARMKAEKEFDETRRQSLPGTAGYNQTNNKDVA